MLVMRYKSLHKKGVLHDVAHAKYKLDLWLERRFAALTLLGFVPW